MQAPTGASDDGRRGSKRRRSLEVFEKHGLLTQSCSALLTQICSVFLTLCSVEVLTSEEPVWDIPSPVDSLGDPSTALNRNSHHISIELKFCAFYSSNEDRVLAESWVLWVKKKY